MKSFACLHVALGMVALICVTSATPLFDIDMVVRAKNDTKTGNTTTTTNGTNTTTNGTNTTTQTTSSNAVCFPHFAQVRIGESRKSIPISQVREGDMVDVGSGKLSPVYLITHADVHTPYEFVSLTTAEGSTLTATAGHYVPVKNRLVAAGSISMGDELTLADGSKSPVVRIQNIMSKGLYSVVTYQGDIVVDGVVASSYTTAADARFAHAALSPLRAAFARFGLVSGWNNAWASYASDMLPIKGASMI